MLLLLLRKRTVAADTASLLLMLGLTIGAQNLVVLARGYASGITFAPSRRPVRARRAHRWAN